MFDNAKLIASEYGFGALLSMVALVVLAWLARVSLQNPITATAEALKAVDQARKALQSEIEHKDQIIEKLRERVQILESQRLEQDQRIARQDEKIEALRAHIRKLEAE